MKILQFADIHCRDKDIEEIEKCLNFIVKVAMAERPDVIINAGDTFDSQHVRLDSRAAKLIFKIFKELADIAPVAVVTGTPSHDSSTVEVLRYIKAKYPVHVSSNSEQIYLCEGDLALDPTKGCCPIEAPVEAVITMVPAPTKQYFRTDSGIELSNEEISQSMSVVFAGFAAQASEYSSAPHILVGHWQTDGAMVSETQTLLGVDISISAAQMALGNFDLIGLGHLHLQQKIEPNIFYSGSIIGLSWGELAPKGFLIHELTKEA